MPGVQARGRVYGRTDWVPAWRLGKGQAASVTAYVPLNFELGEAFQLNWNEEGLVVGGIHYRVQVVTWSYAAFEPFHDTVTKPRPGRLFGLEPSSTDVLSE